jgi:hypothetical protein
MSAFLEKPSFPVIILIMITPKLKMSNLLETKLCKMYSGGKYPLHDVMNDGSIYRRVFWKKKDKLTYNK